MANGKLKVQELPTTRKDGEVVAWENSALFSSQDFPRYNPDSLVQRHGLRIYAKMMIDEQVKAALTFKRDAVTSRDWMLDWPKGTKLSDTEKTRRSDLLTYMLCAMKGAFVDKLNAILSGLVYGYSITEKAYGEFEFDGRPQSGIVALLPKDCSTFWFYTDDYGQLQDFRQKIAGKEQSLDLGKFVHYVHAPEEDEWYGTSELRAAYRSYYAKDLMIKYWLIWGERAAGGFVKATRTADAQIQPNTAAWTALQTALSQIKTVGSILLPVGIDLEMIMPPSNDGFEKAIQFHDLAIAKAMLVPNLMGISHTGETGAYSQSQTQLEAFFWTLNATSRRLSSVITEQILKDAGEYLFTDGLVPEFCFKPASLEHVKWVVDAWKNLVGAKAVTTTPEDEERLRQILEMPAKTPDEIQAAQDEAHQKAIEVAAKGNPFSPDQQKPPVKPNGAATYGRVDLEWDESKHPRVPAGSEAGGQFGGGDGGGAGGAEKANRGAGGVSAEQFHQVESRQAEKLGVPSNDPAALSNYERGGKLSPEEEAAYRTAVDQYNNLEDTDGGRILNVDLARELSSDYAASLDSRSALSAAVHEPSSSFIKRLYAEKLAEQAAAGDDNSVLFTAGGTGAGKTSAIENVPAVSDLETHSQIVYDTNMDKFASAQSKIDQALAAGKDVNVAYVYRDPTDAFGAMIKRAEGKGRTVPLEVHQQTHVNSMETVQRLSRYYEGNKRVNFYAIDNSQGGKGTATRSSLDAIYSKKYNVSAGELRNVIEGYKAAGQVSDRVYQGVIGRRATHARRAHVQGVVRQARERYGEEPEQEAQRARLRQLALTRASNRVNFSVVATREEAIAQRAVPAAADVIARGVKKAVPAADVANYTDFDVARIADVALDGPTIGKLRSVFVDSLRTSWDIGASMARNEIDRARGGTLTRSVAKLEALRDKAGEFLAANGFRMAGNASDATKAIIQQELLSGVKGGGSPTQVRTNIWDRLVSRGILTRAAVLAVETDSAVHAALDSLWQDSEEGAAAYLNTLVRTNMFEAMNEARYEEFTDPALGDFIVALEYSAILDDRTTEICTELNGDIWKPDSPMWDTYRPPNHYNCRSLLVPITAVDGWDGQESPEPSVQPQDGFGGGA